LFQTCPGGKVTIPLQNISFPYKSNGQPYSVTFEHT